MAGNSGLRSGDPGKSVTKTGTLLGKITKPPCAVLPDPAAPFTVVGWPHAHDTRFHTCALCGIMWNAVRVNCVLCTPTDGISLRETEERPTVKAEACETCHGYATVLPRGERPTAGGADDGAALGLDMLLAEDGWTRGGANPLLLGH
jgi:FdhE protein